MTKKKMTPKKKGPTKAEVKAAERILLRSRNAEFEKERVRKAGLIGKCYKTRNTYGGDCEGWWLYVTPTHFSEHGTLMGMKFQHTSRDILEVELNAWCEYLDRGGYTEISREVFDEAKAEFLATAVERLS